MKWLDLFSGIGMYGLGLEQAGHEIVGFCENEKWARQILKKHWPTKPISWSIQSLNKALALMPLLAASHAKTYLTRDSVPDYPGDVQDSFGRWLRPFAWYDPDTGSWRTWQQSLIEGWEPFLGPWPAAGMMRNGIAWERQPLAHPTIAPAHTFLPTIPAVEGKGASRSRYIGSLNTKVGKMSEALRTCEQDPAYLNPLFGEVVMGLPKGFTDLATETRRASSENLRETSNKGDE